MKQLSIIIPTFNRAAGLDRLLAWLQQQDIPHQDSELIVVNDGSADTTQEVLQTWVARFGDGWLLPLSQSNAGQSKARAAGVERSTGRFLLFLDDDMEPADPRFLRCHMEFHQNSQRETVALGAILAPPGNPRRPAFEHFYEKSIDTMHLHFNSGKIQPSGEHFFTANVSLPKNLYLKAGGFDRSYRFAEDRELGLRLAYKHQAAFHFLRDAAAYHHSPTGRFEAFIRRARAYGLYDLRMAKNYPDRPDLHPQQMLDDPQAFKRTLARVAYAMPAVSDRLNGSLVFTAKALHRLRLTPLAIKVCSVLFCINYMSGLKRAQEEEGRHEGT